MKKKQSLFGLAFVMILTSVAAHGATEIDASFAGVVGSLSDTLSAETTYDGNISGSDLLTGASISSTATPDLGPFYGSSLTGLNDGLASDGIRSNPAGEISNDTLWFAASLASTPEVTFTLNTVSNPGGYTLSSVNSINGWDTQNSLSDQDYTISYSTVANPSVFIPLYTVAYNPFEPADDNVGAPFNSSQVTLTNLTGATGVAAVRFNFSLYTSPTTSTPQIGQLIREIDVFGAPTDVPEPSTWTLLFTGLGALIVVQRLRRKQRI